jgi:hypothetical protein
LISEVSLTHNKDNKTYALQSSNSADILVRDIGSITNDGADHRLSMMTLIVGLMQRHSVHRDIRNCEQSRYGLQTTCENARRGVKRNVRGDIKKKWHKTYELVWASILQGAFAKLRKPTFGFMSVRPYGTIRLHLTDFHEI